MVHSAELDLDQYSQLRSPIDGRIGDRRVAVGNLVTGGAGANTTLLATVVSVDPIRFEFTFDEQSYLRYVRYASASKDVAALNGNVPVTLELIDENDFKHTGKIDFVDNAINTSTGTIRGRAVFDNAGRNFHARHVRPPARAGLAALYARCSCPMPRSAPNRCANMCWWSTMSGMVHQKYVTLGQLDGGLRVIKDGLDANDRVIVNGLMRARAGIKVNAQEQAAPAAATPRRPRKPAMPPTARAATSKPIDPDQCVSRTSSSTGRSLPPWSRSFS